MRHRNGCVDFNDAASFYYEEKDDDLNRGNANRNGKL